MEMDKTQTLEEHLRHITEMMRPHLLVRGGGQRTAYSCVHEFVLRHGRSFKPAACLRKYTKGSLPKQCYRNSQHIAKKYDLIYVEGFAVGVLPVSHAWCVAPGSDEVIDPTWYEGRVGIGLEYFGVPIKIGYAIKSSRESQQYSVLDNWGMGWPILRDDESLWKESI